MLCPAILTNSVRLSSKTETFVALKVEIGSWRWNSVPFYLRTGKRLPARVSEIVVTFKPIPHSVFDDGAGPIDTNRLVIRLQPDEGVKLWLMIKDPGPGGMRLQHVPLDMSFAEAFGVRNPDAYERLIMDVVRGNQTLFMRRDEVEAAWSWIDPVLDAWAESADLPKPYTAGTWGPAAAVALIERDGRTWHEDDVEMISERKLFASRQELAAALASDVAASLSAAITDRGRAQLAVSGGTTPKLFFHELAHIKIDWSRVTITLVDERCVPITDDRSNARLVREQLLTIEGRVGQVRAALWRAMATRKSSAPSMSLSSAWEPTATRHRSFRGATILARRSMS